MRFNFLFALALIIISAVVVSAQDKAQITTEKINVFAIVSDEIYGITKDASEVLFSEHELDTFTRRGFQVHCTLYMTQYPKNSLDKVAQKIASIANKTKSFDITSSGLEQTADNWLFVNIERNSNLQTLCDLTVKTLASMRSKTKFVPDWAKSFPTKVEYIEKYGSPNVYSEFNPHLTLLAKSDASKLTAFIKNNTRFNSKVQGKVIAIGLGIADRDGQIETPYKIFPLK